MQINKRSRFPQINQRICSNFLFFVTFRGFPLFKNRYNSFLNFVSHILHLKDESLTKDDVSLSF